MRPGVTEVISEGDRADKGHSGGDSPRTNGDGSSLGEDAHEPGPLWVVTGAGGFLGNNVVRQLLSRGRHVRAAVFEDHVPPALEGLDVEVVQMDVRNLDSVNAAFSAPSSEVWVVHCAGIVSIAGEVSAEIYDVNVTGVKNVLAARREQGVAKLVYVSSVHALPVVEGTAVELDAASDFNPEQLDGAYSRTKAEATALVLAATDLWRVVVFPTGLLGPHDFADTHLTRMVRDTASGALPMSVEGGYDFVDVRDVAAGIIRAAEIGTNGRTCVLSEQYVTVKRTVGAVANAVGRPTPPALPLWAARAVAPTAERISALRGVAPTMTAYSLKVLGEPGLFSSRRAREELGYRARPFRKTLRDTLEWVRRDG